ASIFWSLQPLTYLHLRAALDEVDAGDLAEASPPAEKPGARPAAPAPARAAASGGSSFVARLCLAVVVMVGPWLLTGWLLALAGGEGAGWLRWRPADGLLPPPNEGLFHAAWVIAMAWGALWAGILAWSALRP